MKTSQNQQANESSRDASGDRRYLVQWEIDVWAGTPLAAARQTLAIQRDPGSTATVFTVISSNGTAQEVDLQTLEEEENHGQ